MKSGTKREAEQRFATSVRNSDINFVTTASGDIFMLI
jgi:hypothetical protein